MKVYWVLTLYLGQESDPKKANISPSSQNNVLDVTGFTQTWLCTPTELEDNPEAGAVFPAFLRLFSLLLTGKSPSSWITACSILLPTAQLPGFRGVMIKVTVM